MNYLELEERIKDGYRVASAQYRRDDEIEVTTAHHRRVCRILRRLCLSFGEPIRVLDMGCGTGRYFHCLRRVRHLTGLDISEEMLEAARTPVLQTEVAVEEVKLVRANAHLVEFSEESFHFVYSLGMFGHGCPVTRELCDKLHQWLVPGGKLFFNIVDFDGLPLWYRARRKTRNVVYSLLSRRLRQLLDKREERSPFFGLNREELESILRETLFPGFTVTSHSCQSPLWNGRLLECLAAKGSSKPVPFSENHVEQTASGQGIRV
jgi:SAM-dependent methyltransferase